MVEAGKGMVFMAWIYGCGSSVLWGLGVVPGWLESHGAPGGGWGVAAKWFLCGLWVAAAMAALVIGFAVLVWVGVSAQGAMKAAKDRAAEDLEEVRVLARIHAEALAIESAAGELAVMGGRGIGCREARLGGAEWIRAWKRGIHPAWLSGVVLGAGWAWSRMLEAATMLRTRIEGLVLFAVVAAVAFVFFPAALIFAWRFWALVLGVPLDDAMSPPELGRRAGEYWLAEGGFCEVEKELGDAEGGGWSLYGWRI